MQHDLVNTLNAALDGNARKRLVGYAYKLISMQQWPGETDLSELAEDIVSEAVCKTIIGERRWDPDKTPCPIDFLASSIRSLVSARGKNSQNSEFLQELDAPGADEIQDYRRSAHKALEAEEFFYGLIEEVGDDEVCAKMVDLFEKGYKPQEIAEELHLEVAEIYAAKKRLIRKTQTYIHKMKVAR